MPTAIAIHFPFRAGPLRQRPPCPTLYPLSPFRSPPRSFSFGFGFGGSTHVPCALPWVWLRVRGEGEAGLLVKFCFDALCCASLWGPSREAFPMGGSCGSFSSPWFQGASFGWSLSFSCFSFARLCVRFSIFVSVLCVRGSVRGCRRPLRRREVGSSYHLFFSLCLWLTSQVCLGSSRGVGGVPVLCRLHQRGESRNRNRSSYHLLAVEFDIVKVNSVERSLFIYISTLVSSKYKISLECVPGFLGSLAV